jgi:hypothetical protein
MTRLELTERESGTLREILESYLSDLKTERIATENRDWHADLKERERIAGDILTRLTVSAT